MSAVVSRTVAKNESTIMRVTYGGSRLFLLIAALTLWTAIESTSAAPPEAGTKLLVPAYFYPDGEGLKTWRKLIAAGSKVPVVAIANPASGPGTAVDPAYTAVIQQAQAGKLMVIGYVSTNYAKRPAADIRHDIDLWLKFYPTIQGIFFDEQSSEAEKSDFYRDLATYARQQIKSAFIVTNPGTICAEEYFSKQIADTICVIESGESLEKYHPPEWARKYPATRFYGLAYHIQQAAGLRKSLNGARQKHLGYAYITDDKLPNPWDTLPAYWDAEVQAIAKP